MMAGSNEYSLKPDQNPKSNEGANGKPASNYGELLEYWDRYKKENPLETPDQAKKRKRREKWEGVIGGISDAVNAMSNLYFTSQGAPNMYNHANSMSAASQARFDKAKAERDRNLANHMSYAMNIGRIKDADRNWRRQLEQDMIAAAQREHDNKIAEAKAEREKAMFEIEQQVANGKLEIAKAQTRIAQVKADFAERQQKADLEIKKTRADANRKLGDSYSNGGNKKQGEFRAYDRDKQPHYFEDRNAAEDFSRQEGTWVEVVESSTTERTDGETTEITKYEKPGRGYSSPTGPVSPIRMKQSKSKTESEW